MFRTALALITYSPLDNIAGILSLVDVPSPAMKPPFLRSCTLPPFVPKTAALALRAANCGLPTIEKIANNDNQRVNNCAAFFNILATKSFSASFPLFAPVMKSIIASAIASPTIVAYFTVLSDQTFAFCSLSVSAFAPSAMRSLLRSTKASKVSFFASNSACNASGLNCNILDIKSISSVE